VNGDDAEPPSLPPWVPVMIGVVLVALAGLAVYTGLRSRAAPDERISTRRPSGGPVERGGAPGEPQAGASRVLHGEGGESIPLPAPTDTGNLARVAITGDRGGVSSTVRYAARRGAMFSIEPADATVFVNDHQIGPANQFSSPDQAYEFPEEGKFTVRLMAPGFRDETLIITADPLAEDEVVRVVRKMVPAG
jgi:hypothetical protein